MALYNNRVCKLFNIQYPIIQAGMVWASGWRLASAVSNAGGLGLIGAGSMHPDTLIEHVRKCKAATNKPYGVNLPLLYSDIDKHIETIINEKVPIVFTSAGNPKTWTALLHQHQCKVVHVVSSMRFALKAEEAGCDAVVAEGFEAGGHNGIEETTTMVLVPSVCSAVNIPVIAAGGIANGKQMAAALALGADAVQMGSRFVCTHEASSHDSFKTAVVKAKEGETMLQLKKIGPTRLLNNRFATEIKKVEEQGANVEELSSLLGRGKAKKGMFEGDIENGELEIGQVSSLINDIKSAADIVHEVWNEFLQVIEKFETIK